MGHFINYVPTSKDMEMAAELQPQAPKNNLIVPQERISCKKEKDLTKFAQKNAE